MRSDKELAFTLRRQGKSYNEIARTLNVAKSTLSNWFKGHDFSVAIKEFITKQTQIASTERLRVLNKARGDLLQAHYAQAEIEAAAELEKHCKDPLFVSGVVAYWGEGDKLHKNQTRLTNTDPKMLKLFVQFLIKFGDFKFSDMRLATFVYADLNINDCRSYWQSQTDITGLHKTMVLPSREKRRRLKYGIATVIVTNTYFKKKLMFWVDHLPKIVLNTVSKV